MELLLVSQVKFLEKSQVELIKKCKMVLLQNIQLELQQETYVILLEKLQVELLTGVILDRALGGGGIPEKLHLVL